MTPFLSIPSSLNPRGLVLFCALVIMLFAAASRSASAAEPGEKTVIGTLREVSVGQRGKQTVIYLRVSGLGKRLWVEENHGTNLNTLHKGDRLKISYLSTTGELISFGPP